MAGYKLLLTLSYDWLEFRQLDTSYSLLHPMADLSPWCWIQLYADSTLRQTQVMAAWYELQLILSCGWLEFHRLDLTYSCFILCLCLLFSLFLKEQCSFWLFQTKWFEKKFNLQLLYLPIVSWTFILSWATTHCPPS